jgi:hypothetical protein
MIPDPEAVLWAFEYFFHTDKANAKTHCAPVRFSPLTFRLCDYLLGVWHDDQDITQEMAEVREAAGKYELDAGR